MSFNPRRPPTKTRVELKSYINEQMKAPTFMELWNELGNLYFLGGQYQQAVYAYQRSIQLEVSPPVSRAAAREETVTLYAVNPPSSTTQSLGSPVHSVVVPAAASWPPGTAPEARANGQSSSSSPASAPAVTTCRAASTPAR